MAKEKKTTSSSWSKKPKLFEDVKSSSNLRLSLHKLAHQFDFSNPVDDPIEIEEVEYPLEDSEQGLACGEETSSVDSSQDNNSALDEIETTEGSFDERATTVGEG